MVIGATSLSACVPRYTPVVAAEQAGAASLTGVQRFELREGDRVRVLTKTGERRELDIVGADETYLVGKSERIAYRDIVFMERLELDFDAPLAVTAGIVIVTVVLAPGVAAAAILSSTP